MIVFNLPAQTAWVNMRFFIKDTHHVLLSFTNVRYPHL